MKDIIEPAKATQYEISKSCQAIARMANSFNATKVKYHKKFRTNVNFKTCLYFTQVVFKTKYKVLKTCNVVFRKDKKLRQRYLKKKLQANFVDFKSRF